MRKRWARPAEPVDRPETVPLFRQVGIVLRKDVRRWSLLIAALVGAVGVWRVRAGLPGSRGDDLSGWGIIVSLVWGVVGMVILEDPPSGDRAFWRTRPVSPRAAFVAKAVLLFLLLILLPTIVQTHWLASVRPGAWQDVWLSSIVTQSALVGLAMLAAALSGSWARYLAVGAVGFLLIVGFGQFWVLTILPSIRLTAVLGVSVTLLAAWQYSRQRTALIGICGLVLVGGIAFAPLHSGPPLVELLVPRPDRVTDFADAASVQLSVQSLGLDPTRSVFVDRSRPTLWGELEVDAPGHVVAVVQAVEGRLIPFGRNRSSRPFDDSGATLGLLGQRFGYRDLAGPERDGRSDNQFQFDLMWGAIDDIDGALSASNGFTVRVTADLYEPTVRGHLPLRPGAALHTPRATFEVESVERFPGNLRVRTSALGPAWNYYWDDARPLPFLLVNPARKEFLASDRGAGQQLILGLVPSFHWLGGSRSIEFKLPEDLPEGWLEGAELQVLGMDYLGSVEQTVTREVDEWPHWGRQVAVDWVEPGTD